MIGSIVSGVICKGLMKVMIPVVITGILGMGISVRGCIKGIEARGKYNSELHNIASINRQNYDTHRNLSEVHEEIKAERDRLREDDQKHRQEIDSLKKRIQVARTAAENKELEECVQCLLDWESLQSSQ